METDSLEEKNKPNHTEENLTPRQLKARRREEILDNIFGTYRPADFENIWGNKMAILGLVLIIGLSIFAYWGTQKGLITWDRTEEEQFSLFNKKKAAEKPVLDTLNAIGIDNKDTKKD